MTSPGPILLAYDGSEDARHAIEHAAAQRPGADVVVLYVRQPLEGLAAHLEGHLALEDVRGIDAAARDGAERLAAEGADLARQAGLKAEPRVAGAIDAAADTIVRVADELDASLIVVGSRGRRRIPVIRNRASIAFDGDVRDVPRAEVERLPRIPRGEIHAAPSRPRNDRRARCSGLGPGFTAGTGAAGPSRCRPCLSR